MEEQKQDSVQQAVQEQVTPQPAQQVAAQPAPQAVQEDKNIQYEKYKKPLKMHVITQVVFSGLALVLVILLLFVPMFSINFEKLSESETELAATLPGVESALEKWLEKGADGDFKLSFSVFDEIKLALSSIGDTDASSITSAMFQIFAIIFLAVSAIIGVVSLIKNISGILNIDNYTVDIYADIKTNADKKRSRKDMYSNPMYWLVSGIIFEVLAVVMGKVMGSVLESGSESATSFISYCNGVSGWIAFIIIFAVLAIAAYVYSSQLKGKVKTQILREDFGIKGK